MNYFWLILKHKWFVFIAGLKVKVPLWRLVVHDLSKLSIKEYPYYQQRFFKNKFDTCEFDKCWLHHQNHNDHHWEYWVTRTTGVNNLENEPIEMTEDALREMIADWMGASRAYNGFWPNESWDWLNENINKMRLHPNTRKRLKEIVNNLGFNINL